MAKSTLYNFHEGWIRSITNFLIGTIDAYSYSIFDVFTYYMQTYFNLLDNILEFGADTILDIEMKPLPGWWKDFMREDDLEDMVGPYYYGRKRTFGEFARNFKTVRTNFGSISKRCTRRLIGDLASLLTLDAPTMHERDQWVIEYNDMNLFSLGLPKVLPYFFTEDEQDLLD